MFTTYYSPEDSKTHVVKEHRLISDWQMIPNIFHSVKGFCGEESKRMEVIYRPRISIHDETVCLRCYEETVGRFGQ